MQVPCVPGFGTSFAVYPGSQPAAPVSVPALPPSMPGSLPVRYEAVTPTEFADDEAYDEEDDYAGYEEDDEDEEEAGFGDQYEYPAEDNVAGGLAGKLTDNTLLLYLNMYMIYDCTKPHLSLIAHIQVDMTAVVRMVNLGLRKGLSKEESLELGFELRHTHARTHSLSLKQLLLNCTQRL